MKRFSFLKLIICIALSIYCGLLFNSKLGSIPPLGKFLNPFTGFWKNAESERGNKDENLSIHGLKDSVSILIDNQGIPHVFAKNDYDAYFAQGFITAKDRLWQLDFQSRYAAGRLSEVVGKKAIELDRYQRRMGMLYGAERMLEESKKDPKSHQALVAYSDGINAYINSLKPKDYPIEFKILDYEPEPWTTLNSALLLKLMSATLASGSDEMKMTNILETYGQHVVDDLFPDQPYKEDPIIPKGTQWNFNPIPSDKKISHAKTPEYLSKSTKSNALDELYAHLLTTKKPENIGSNNWAISSQKSQSKMPLLANDPHLNLTLPSIWYQIQLHTPDLNVYGASLPGAPGIIIGFNQHAAWGVTNVGADVLDWYQIHFKDDSNQEYLYDGKWQKTTTRIESIQVLDGPTLLDTVYYTVHGPVSYTANTKPRDFDPAKNVPIGFALKWVAHLPSNEIKTFYELNRSKSYEDYRKAITFYTAPAQNFIFANNQNEIAITSNGFFPLKEKNQGKFLLNGEVSSSNWDKQIPYNQLPSIKNPDRGFVSSANQSPTDALYPYYINWEFAPYERGHRINTVLDSLDNITVDDFIALQNDTYSLLAENIVNQLTTSLDNAILSDTEKEGLALVKKWNKRYEANSIAASIFETWYNSINDYIWYTKFGKPDIFMRYPARDRTVKMLLTEPNSPWYSNNLSPKEESRKDVITLSFKKAIETLTMTFGDNKSEWEWAKVKESHVPHLANLKGFGSKALRIGGSKHTVNAMSEKNGPSWKMVVQLGEEPKAFGVLPGGSSGNPGSKYYDNQLSTWEQGKLVPLLFLKNTRQKENILSTIQLNP